jgi:hypothetical protein
MSIYEASLDHEIHMNLPVELYQDNYQPIKLKLNKCLYGLKQVEDGITLLMMLFHNLNLHDAYMTNGSISIETKKLIYNVLLVVH